MEAQNLPVQQQANTTQAVFNFFDQNQFEVMQRVCKMFASSELVPDMYKTNLLPDKDGKPTNPENKAMANCMIALEMAQRIGASPLAVMQNMIIIYGRPSWSSKFLVATVNTCGRFNPLQYKFTNLGKVGKISITEYVWDNTAKRKVAKNVEFDGTQIDNLQCIAYTSAKGSTEVLESAPIDIKLAVQEGWYLKAGSKWQTMTRQMLMYRAASFWTNAYAPELSMGMKTDDEIRDIIDIDYEDVTAQVAREKTDNANKQELTMDEPEDTSKQPAPPVPNAPQTEKPAATPTPAPTPQDNTITPTELFGADKAGSTPPKGPGF